MRWVCRHIERTRREVVFKATGLQYLWRAVVAVLGCSFIIPIPWVLRWIMRWHASQIVLAEQDFTPAYEEHASLALAKRAFLRN